MGIFKKLFTKCNINNLSFKERYEIAISEGNIPAATKAIKQAVDTCPCRDEKCLNNIFCPDCNKGNGFLKKEDDVIDIRKNLE